MGFADLLVNNADRHELNFLVQNDGKVWGIDNGLAFIPESLEEVADQPLILMKEDETGKKVQVETTVLENIKEKGAVPLRSVPLEQVTQGKNYVPLPEDLQTSLELFLQNTELQNAARNLLKDTLKKGDL